MCPWDEGICIPATDFVAEQAATLSALSSGLGLTSKSAAAQVDASPMFDVYDSQVAHMPDVISTATSPTVSVALSPEDNLTAGGECATGWVLTSAQKCRSVVQHRCASGSWELHLHLSNLSAPVAQCKR